MKKRVECECGWSCEDDEDRVVAAVVVHCEIAHEGRVPDREQILAAARPIPERE